MMRMMFSCGEMSVAAVRVVVVAAVSSPQRTIPSKRIHSMRMIPLVGVVLSFWLLFLFVVVVKVPYRSVTDVVVVVMMMMMMMLMVKVIEDDIRNLDRRGRKQQLGCLWVTT